MLRIKQERTSRFQRLVFYRKSKGEYEMAELKIRGIKESKLIKLKELAKRNNYPSLNAYLLEKMEELAEEIEVVEYRKKYLSTQEKNIKVIEENTEVMKKLFEFLEGN